MTIKKLMFTASSCQACPIVKPFAEEHDFDIISLDTDNGLALANLHNVRGLPTILLIDEWGNYLIRKIGSLNFKDKNELLEIITNEN